jgi:membrane fusion protein, multidrug efflux system
MADGDIRGDVREQADRPGQAPAQARAGKEARPWARLGMLLLLAVLVGGGVYYWWSTRDLVETDDAYTDGRAVTIAPHVAGYVVSLDVNDNQFVHKGDPLIHIDPRDYIAARDKALGQVRTAEGQFGAASAAYEVAQADFPARLSEAEANVANARAALFRAQTDYRRQHSMPPAATTQQQVDYATAAQQAALAGLAQAEAQLRQAMPVKPNIGQTAATVTQREGALLEARAQLAQAELDLGWCVVRAPQDGWVTRRNVEQGNYVQPGQQILAIVSPEVWVTANFKESQLDRMRPGQTVRLSVDAYPGLRLIGHVDSIQLGSGSKFTAFPPENATGNFVKIVQRVPVKIVIDSGLDPHLPLPLGISVVPTVMLK